MSKLRIILADDHKIIRDGLKALINSQPDMEVVGEAGDGLDVLDKAKATRPDVVIMDVSMPKLSGASAAERLKRECPEVKVLALTAHENKGYLDQLLRAGARGYVLKLAAAEALINAIRIVAEGGIYLDPALAGKVLDSYIRRRTPKDELQGGDLSDREAEVLRLVAWGYSNKEISARLNLSVKTVETYKMRAMEKLELKSRADVVRYAVSQGWLQGT